MSRMIAVSGSASGIGRAPAELLRGQGDEVIGVDPRMFKAMNEAVPMPLNGYAEAVVIAESLRWLISPANSHMAGQVVYVDGGAEAVLRGPRVF